MAVIIKEPGMMAANVHNSGEDNQNMMPRVTMHAKAQWANKRNTGHRHSPVHLDWQKCGKRNKRLMLLPPKGKRKVALEQARCMRTIGDLCIAWRRWNETLGRHAAPA